MKRDEVGEILLPHEELEDGSFEDVAAVLADGTITRARAIKLAGAALLAGTGMMALLQSPAEARKRRRRRRRRKKAVTTDPRQVDFGEQPVGIPSTENVTIENNGTEPVYVQPELGNGFTLGPSFDASAPILPGTSATVPIVFTPAEEGVTTGELVISDAPDASGNTVTVVALTGTGVSASA